MKTIPCHVFNREFVDDNALNAGLESCWPNKNGLSSRTQKIAVAT